MGAKIKREPVTVRLNSEIILLGRSLARSLYGGEDKLGVLIEESINLLSSQQENDTRANALLKNTEQNLFNRFDNQVESMYQELTKRDNKLTERMASLIAISSFETALAELMLKDLYCRDEKSKARYEELRSLASKKMKNRYEKANVTEVLELQEQVRDLEKEIENIQSSFASKEKDIYDLKERKDVLSKNLSETDKNLSTTKKHLKEVIEAYKAQTKLIEWYAKRDKDIPGIQEKNKKLLSKQSYEDAAREFEQENPRPKLRSE